MFDSLEALQSHLEERSFDYRYLAEIGELFKEIRDAFGKSGNLGNAKLAQYDLDAFNLMAKDGQLGAQFIFTNEQGEEVRIPDITKFPEEEFGYFTDRLQQTKNPRLKARYAHILWQSPSKRQQYAEAAIAAYLEQIPVYCIQANSTEDDDPKKIRLECAVLECVTSGLNLAVSSRSNIQDVVTEIWRLTQDPDSSNLPRYSLTRDLITLILKYRKYFEKQELSNLCSQCLEIADQLVTDNEIGRAIRMNELGQRVDTVLKLKTADWNKRIAECYETLMERRKKSPLVAAELCQRAVDYYKAATDHAKVEELTRKREQFSGEIEFREFSIQFDQTDHIAWCEGIGKELSSLSTYEILSTIACSPDLLPLKDDMERQARLSAKETPFLSLMSEAVMDDRMHVAEHATTLEEKLKHGILNQFKFYLKNEKIPLINAVIYNAFRAGKLDAEKVLKSLTESSWIGATLIRRRGSGRKYEYCWIDQLSPAIRKYFSYMKNLLEDNEPKEPPIMPIDSLTLKFEGLIRDYAQGHKIVTSFDSGRELGRTVTREKDVSALLYDQRIANLFNSDDLLFFRFLFVDQSGFTLRHRVAHGLMLIEDYNFGILQLLFVALMRLSKYPMESEQPTKSVQDN